MRTTSFLTVLAAFVCFAAPAIEPVLPPGAWWDNDRVITHLQLDDEQRQAIRSSSIESAKRLIDLKAELDKSEIDLKAMAADPTLEAETARATYGHFLDARRALAMERFELYLDVRRVLKPPQIQALHRLIDHRQRTRPRGESPRRP